MKMEQTERLIQLLNFLKESQNDSFLKFAIAKEHEKMSQNDKALKYYMDIYENDPKYIGLYYHLAKLYESLNERVLAIKIYEEGIATGKDLGDFHAVSELNNAKMNLQLEMDN